MPAQGSSPRKTMTTTAEIAAYLDVLLGVVDCPDYPNAVNGLQLSNSGRVTKVAACVDFSARAIARTVEAEANLLLVHHGMFWGGVRPITGPAYSRLRKLIENDIAVYSSHLPLDKHPTFGNNVLLSREFGLEPSGDFARYRDIAIGVSGESDVLTEQLVDRARRFAKAHGGDVIATEFPEGRRTARWAICTGAGASAETLDEATEAGIDTLIVGEGPHWTAVEANERGLVIIYAGHYATETPGVAALSHHLSEHFGLNWTMIDVPTGL